MSLGEKGRDDRCKDHKTPIPHSCRQTLLKFSWEKDQETRQIKRQREKKEKVQRKKREKRVVSVQSLQVAVCSTVRL